LDFLFLIEDFGDWLRNDGHIIWIISLVFAYGAYLLTTEEAKKTWLIIAVYYSGPILVSQ
jgi:hypothetical protein